MSSEILSIDTSGTRGKHVGPRDSRVKLTVVAQRQLGCQERRRDVFARSDRARIADIDDAAASAACGERGAERARAWTRADAVLSKTHPPTTYVMPVMFVLSCVVCSVRARGAHRDDI